jgi:4-diphosphocytidyl-2-C-methyl-D-erythritol kinase
LRQPEPHTATVEARAKVNLFLRVLGRRADGYHDLQSLIVPIDLADRLKIHAVSDSTEFRTLSLSLQVTGQEELIRGVPADDSNLVLRAASALADRAHPRGFADVTLDKRVPTAGGLGGGSADAAATLKALNHLWACGLDHRELLEVAAEVGSDVPALLLGGAVMAEGRGERVEPSSIPRLNLALATFSFGVSTADAFRWWDEDGASTGRDPASILDQVDRDGRGEGHVDPQPLAQLLYNDLERSVTRRHPIVGEVKDLLLHAGALAAVMSGSGPSLFSILPPEMAQLEGPEWEALSRLAGRPVLRLGTEPVRKE